MWTAVDPAEQFWSGYAYAGNGTNPISCKDNDGARIEFAPGVSGGFRNEFATAIKYLNNHNASGVIARLEARPELILIQEGVALSDNFYETSTLDPAVIQNQITWNPFSALTSTDAAGNVVTQSPALGLLHESAHALQDLSNNAQLIRDVSTPDPNFSQAEDRRVITGPESRAARATGEGVRATHGGNDYRVPHSDQR